jgi:hypothetical protein
MNSSIGHAANLLMLKTSGNSLQSHGVEAESEAGDWAQDNPVEEEAFSEVPQFLKEPKSLCRKSRNLPYSTLNFHANSLLQELVLDLELKDKRSQGV